MFIFVRALTALLGLSATHGFVVLGLPGPVQAELLKRAQDEKLTSRQLQALAAAQRPKRLTGRKPKPGFVKALGRFRKMVDDEDFELDKVSDLDIIQAHELLRTSRHLQEQLAKVTARLEERVRGE